MIVAFSAGALRQIEAILAHVAASSPRGAGRIEARIRAAARMIGDHPQAGAPTDRQGVRRVVLTPFPYVLFYREVGGRIVVQRIRHTARRV